MIDGAPAGTVDAVAWHCYAPGGANWSSLAQFHAANGGAVVQVMTECWLHLGSGEGFFDLPDFVLGPVKNYAAGAIAWILGGSVDYDLGFPGRDSCGECSGIVQVNMTAGTYEKTQDFYTLGQFSKFVKKGAVCLATEGSGSMGVVAFRNEATAAGQMKEGEHGAGGGKSGDIVLVVVNKAETDKTLSVALESGKGNYTLYVEASSVTTLLLPGNT